MSINKKIKVINNKIEQRNAQYDLHRQTAKISALSLGNVSKYEFLTRKDFLPEKHPAEKATTEKRFEYSPLGKESKAQTDNTKKQYQISEKIYESDETINKTLTSENYNKSDLTYNTNHSFYK